MEVAKLPGLRQAMCQRDQHHLDRVDHRATADRNNQVRCCGTGCIRSGQHTFARRVFATFVKCADTAAAQSVPDFGHHVGLAIQGASGHDEKALGTAPVRLFDHRLRRRLAPDHPILRKKFM